MKNSNGAVLGTVTMSDGRDVTIRLGAPLDEIGCDVPRIMSEDAPSSSIVRRVRAIKAASDRWGCDAACLRGEA